VAFKAAAAATPAIGVFRGVLLYVCQGSYRANPVGVKRYDLKPQ
jgi:hypothetical protein